MFAEGFDLLLEGVAPVINAWPAELAAEATPFALRVGYQLMGRVFAEAPARFDGIALNKNPAVLRAAVERFAEKIRPPRGTL